MTSSGLVSDLILGSQKVTGKVLVAFCTRNMLDKTVHLTFSDSVLAANMPNTCRNTIESTQMTANDNRYIY